MDIRIIERSDSYARDHFSWRTQPQFLKHNPVEIIDFDTFLGRLQKRSSDLSALRDYAFFDFYIEADGKVVGNILLKDISHMMKTAEIGFGISEDHYGKGITTQALEAFIKKVFNETDLRKLIAYVHVDNIASWRVLEKNGFQREGVLRQHYILNGEPRDHYCYGLLRSETVL